MAGCLLGSPCQPGGTEIRTISTSDVGERVHVSGKVDVGMWRGNIGVLRVKDGSGLMPGADGIAVYLYERGTYEAIVREYEPDGGPLCITLHATVCETDGVCLEEPSILSLSQK